MSEEAKVPFECVVSADIFRRALAAVSKEETRYYLNGVQIEPCEHGGALLIATDGHRMIVLHDADAVVRHGTGIVQLNKDMVKALSAKAWRLPSWLGPMTGKGLKKRLVLVRGDKAAVAEIAVGKDEAVDADAMLDLVDTPTQSVGAYQWLGALIHGTFPDWRRVIGEPATKPAPIGPFDPAVLAPLAEALRVQGTRGCRLVATKDDATLNSAVFVFPTRGAAGFGIIMPLRDDGAFPALPQWIQPLTQMAAE